MLFVAHNKIVLSSSILAINLSRILATLLSLPSNFSTESPTLPTGILLPSLTSVATLIIGLSNACLCILVKTKSVDNKGRNGPLSIGGN